MAELGVFIIWQSGEEYANDIINDLKENFDICYTKTIEWQKDEVYKNLNKLYPHRKFNAKSPKVKEIGTDDSNVRLHFIVVKDNNPNIVDNININFKNLKDSYRKKYKTNFLHSADNETEAIDNIKKVLEFDDKRIEALKQNKIYIVFDRNLKKIIFSDIIKFDNIEDVFDRLEKCNISYVVLRNWDELDEDIITLEHGDVDIMVDDFYKTIACLNAKQNTKLDYRVQYKITIDNREIPFDIRHIGDNYYDINWQKEILNTRDKFKYFYIPNKTQYYYTLLYHALMHKPYLSDEYKRKVISVDKNLEPNLKTLKNFLVQNNYKIVTPKDKSVYYRYSMKHYKNMLKQYLLKYKFFQKLKDIIKGKR